MGVGASFLSGDKSESDEGMGMDSDSYLQNGERSNPGLDLLAASWSHVSSHLAIESVR